MNLASFAAFVSARVGLPVDEDGLGSDLDDKDLDLLDDLDPDLDLLEDLDLVEEAAELADDDLKLADDDLELADDELELELGELTALMVPPADWLNDRGAFMATVLRGCFIAAGKDFFGFSACFFAIGMTTGEALGRFAGDGLAEGTSSVSELELVEAMIMAKSPT